MELNHITLDPFQNEAIDYLDKGLSVIVSAPTGSGKTLIAEYIIEKCLKEGKGIIYTAPIKALSNQKFRDFSAKFPESVGIITGDVKINPHASVLIMTTEIFRNYLLQDIEKLQNKKWVIFDEVHYLDDIERGTVWEESIIFLPQNMKMLALSATLPNIDQFIAWIEKTHNHPVKKIEEHKRAVPLHFYFQADNRIFSNVSELEYHTLKNKDEFFKNNRVDSLIKYSQENAFLPCIYFCFSRAKCEKFAQEMLKYNFLNKEEETRIKELYNSYTKKFKIRHHHSTSFMLSLLERGIAYHHAGLLPPLKEIIERIFTEKLIKVIFTTETFALGINMPSRTVCFDEISKYYRGKTRYLRKRDFYQMAGRAGRRGIDKEGFVISRLKPYKEDVTAIKRILQGNPEPIKSQFNASYATILNLYHDTGDALLEIYPKTFHYFQFGKRKGSEKKILEAKLKLLKQLRYIQNDKLTMKGQFASNMFGYELIIGELWDKGFFERLSWVELGIIICAIITEVRGKEYLPKLDKRLKKIKREMWLATHQIQRIEKRFRIFPHTKTIHFQLTDAMHAWLMGKDFNQIIDKVSSDEGEIIRNFRMTNQVLRDMDQKIVTDSLRSKIHKTTSIINRDIVNAEWQLKI
ncbi:MAG: DEAD/DEAH box helicase [Candidatus Saelkia tenebricola]|nr:DEAD/DEAH box helicase [Candidatus Saelkia tenebricola]